MTIVFGLAITFVVGRLFWNRSRPGRRRLKSLSRAKMLRLLQRPAPEPLIGAAHAELVAISSRIQAARNTAFGMFSRGLREAEAGWKGELAFRRTVETVHALLLYGRFERARLAWNEVEVPRSIHLRLLALRVDFLFGMLEKHDFRRATVTAHQGLELARSTSLDADPAAATVRQQWAVYVLISEVLAGRRPAKELQDTLRDVNHAHAEVLGRWALASAATSDPEQHAARLSAYRALAPYGVQTLESSAHSS